MLQDRLALSERRACRVTGQHRSTPRRVLRRGRGDEALRQQLRACSRDHPRWGYRRAWALRDWCRFAGTGTSHIDPGAPWENPFVESFGSRLRDELLAVEQFDTRLEAHVVIEDWRIEYNTRRPHSSPGWLAPATYAGRWEADRLPGLSYAVDARRGSGQ